MAEVELVNKNYTCPICYAKVPIILDGKMRMCDCNKMGIDCTKEYTRIIGYTPMEDPTFEQWYQRFERTIEILREAYKKTKSK